MNTRDIFCANDQAITPHSVEIDVNGEFLFTCDCGRFFKLPGDMTRDDINDAIEVHQSANEGQITEVQLEEENARKLAEAVVEVEVEE